MVPPSVCPDTVPAVHLHPLRQQPVQSRTVVVRSGCADRESLRVVPACRNQQAGSCATIEGSGGGMHHLVKVTLFGCQNSYIPLDNCTPGPQLLANVFVPARTFGLGGVPSAAVTQIRGAIPPANGSRNFARTSAVGQRGRWLRPYRCHDLAVNINNGSPTKSHLAPTAGLPFCQRIGTKIPSNKPN